MGRVEEASKVEIGAWCCNVVYTNVDHEVQATLVQSVVGSIQVISSTEMESQEIIVLRPARQHLALASKPTHLVHTVEEQCTHP